MSSLKSIISQDLAIVDDGYMTVWGDWDSLKPKELSRTEGGLKAIADNIRFWIHANGKYDLSMSRAETMYLALQTLRAAAGPDTFLIGCGCPLGPTIGYMDGLRMNADTGPTGILIFLFHGGIKLLFKAFAR